MSTQPRISAVILNTFLDLLIPLFLTAAGGDLDTARAAALELLADFNPRSPREIDLATQAIGNGIKSLTMLGKTTEPGLSLADITSAIKAATSLARAGHQAQRRLENLQMTRRIGAGLQPPEDEAQPDPAPEAAPSAPSGRSTPMTDASPPPTPDQAADDVATAEMTLAKAEKLLTLMQNHVKGGVPPHSPAAQQLRDQRRAVDAARMALAQARRRAQQSGKQEAAEAAG